MTTNLNFFKKRVGGIVMAAAMAVALVVPVAAKAAVTYVNNADWIIVPYNSTKTTHLICGSKYDMGKLTVTSTGAETVTTLNCILNGQHEVVAGKSKREYNATAKSGVGKHQVTYSCKGAAYGRASGWYTK